jgi:hypothetical protein
MLGASRAALRPLLFGAILGVLLWSGRAHAADLILNGTTVTLGGEKTYGKVELTNGARILVPAFNGADKVNTGNLVIRADSILIDKASAIIAKGAGYQAGICRDGAGPASAPKSGGRGGCGVRDSAGGGAHFGGGGRGTKDCPASGCVFLQDWEEDCVGAVSGGTCVSTTDCRNNDALPTVAGQSFFHSIYTPDFGAAGGDKGCRDGDGFTPSAGTSVALTGGNGGGRIVLFAANAGQTGTLTIHGRVTANGNRGCGSGNDSAGGGAGGTVLLIGDNVTIGAQAAVLAAGGRGGDTQPKCLPCAANSDCGTGQTCQGGRCGPCNCTPCTSNAQCNASLGQTCKTLAIGQVCADATNACTPFDTNDNEVECKGTQFTGTCDDCGGGGGGGIVNVLSRVASIQPAARFDVSGSVGGICPMCSGEAGGGAGELQIDGAYVGEICDGFDNDFNGTVDDGLPLLNCNGTPQPSCVNGVPQTCPANVPACVDPVTDTRPRFVVILDTSGSMLNDVAGSPRFGDGSVGHAGVDGNKSRLFIAKSALNNVLAAFPHADYALARYHQDASTRRSCQAASWFECQKLCCSYDNPTDNTTPLFPNPPGCNLSKLYPGAGYPGSFNSNANIGWSGQGDCINYAGSCGAPRRGADVLVGFQKPMEQALMWLDGAETGFNDGSLAGDYCDFASGGDCEVRATGPTPLAGALQAAQDYLKPIIQCDGAVPCRKYGVILLTDGAESCQGDPVAAANALRTAVPGISVDTHVIGFSTLPGETVQLNAIAAAGGTGAALFASDEGTLSNALAGIVASSMKFETCNDLDDDCDGKIDEDFPEKGLPCSDGKLGICLGLGKRVCNGAGDGTVCQIDQPGQAPATEICNNIDDNCNGLVDEGGVCQSCVPTQEVCNGLDDDCDDVIDNDPLDVGIECGLNIGECSSGLTICVNGALTCSGETPATLEACNGLDDDCNGVVDGMSAPCYSGADGTIDVGVCRAGSQLCAAVVGSGATTWGECIGQILPSSELCDGLDNDCNGLADDQVSDGQGHSTGDACCRFGAKCGEGVCTEGAYACAGSQVVCAGGVGPSMELCDGLDNDCNGIVDDVPGQGMACAMPGGCAGIFECELGTGLVCIAAASGLEVCNGLDDDCDGSIDEEPDVTENDSSIGVECDAPISPNDAPPCMAGKTVCKAGGPICEGAVTSQPEVCNGVDDDCNGTIDDGSPCAEGLVCRDGQCLSPCAGGEFPCPGGEACIDQVCVPNAGTGGSGGEGGAAGAGGTTAQGGTGGATTTTAGGAGGQTSGSMTSNVVADDDNVYGLASGGGGCACNLPGDLPGDRRGLLMAALGLVALGRRRSSRAQGPLAGGAK